MKIRSATLCLLWVSVVCVGMLTGCGGGSSDGRVPAAGTVTLDGQPLPNGTIRFLTPEGQVEGVGMVTDGAFQVRQTANSEGVLPGTYTATVESWEQEPGAVIDGEIVAEGVRAIDAKFSDPAQSGLSVTIPEGGDTTLKLELKSGS